MTGDIVATAKRMARYGHTDWIVWIGRDGIRCAAPVNYKFIKQAMLATGTQGTFTLYAASCGTSHLMTWPVAASYLRTARFNERCERAA
jgi:hypothetical protein